MLTTILCGKWHFERVTTKRHCVAMCVPASGGDQRNPCGAPLTLCADYQRLDHEIGNGTQSEKHESKVFARENLNRIRVSTDMAG